MSFPSEIIEDLTERAEQAETEVERLQGLLGRAHDLFVICKEALDRIAVHSPVFPGQPGFDPSSFAHEQLGSACQTIADYEQALADALSSGSKESDAGAGCAVCGSQLIGSCTLPECPNPLTEVRGSSGSTGEEQS